MALRCVMLRALAALALFFASACDADLAVSDAGSEDLATARADLAAISDARIDDAMLGDLAAPALPDAGGDMAATPDLLAAPDLVTLVRYDGDGPVAFAVHNFVVDAGNGRFTVAVYLPAGMGPAPVVSVSPGLQQKTAAYHPYGRRLASHGMIALLRDDPGPFTNTTRVTQDLAHTIANWLPAQHGDGNSPLFGRVDTARVGLAGHSRGGKASLIAASVQLKGKVSGWFGLDPVDSSLLAGGVQARDSVGGVGVPTVFLGATAASACSPANDNYEVLYARAPSPSLKIAAVDAGHTQFQDQGSCVACNLCVPEGKADARVVLAYSLRYLTAFFSRELLGDAAVGAKLEGAGGPLDEAAGRVRFTAK